MDVDTFINENDLEQSKFKSIKVEKALDVKCDLGNLLLTDINFLNDGLLRSKADSSTYLKELTRDNVQLLAAKLWELPTERQDNVIIAKLPIPVTRLPREKPLPSENVTTKWQKFAQMKGIQKRKKSRMQWDDDLKKWVPKWGYKRGNDDTKSWLIEVPQNADPNEDQFEKRIKAKKERIAKNELQRLRNLSRNSKGKVPGVGIMPIKSSLEKDKLGQQYSVSRTSTASLGRFDKRIPKEKPIKSGIRKKKQSNFQEMKLEKEKYLSIFEKIKSNAPLVNPNAAANYLKAQQENKISVQRKEKGIDVKRSKKTSKKTRGTSKHSANKKANKLKNRKSK